LGTYLLLEEKQGLLLVDQHAAHERVLYERLRASWLGGSVERQALLFPTTVELEAPALAALVEHGELVQALGFEVEPFCERTLAVRAVPALLAERDPLGLIRGLAEELRSGAQAGASMQPGAAILEGADRLFATMACHSARRAGEVLDPAEQRALLDSLDAIPWAPSCPHGRPVAIPITRSEIERRFGR
jgi:DNA mismatch repair protein MutL